jgi:hypothetical protein
MACDAVEGEPPQDPELGFHLNMAEDQMQVAQVANDLQADVTVQQTLIHTHFQELLNQLEH